MRCEQETTPAGPQAPASAAEIILTKHSRSLSGGEWYVGQIGSYWFEALVFVEPSQYGIDGGQVSKLCLLDGPRKRDGREVACYDRGWDLAPEEAPVQEAITQLVEDLSRRERGR
jgi:hypothetical protein